MKSTERIALIRVFSDLILADHVIDGGEMEYYYNLKDSFRLSREEEIEARQYTLSQALDVLREADPELRADLLRHCRTLSVSDGFCARSEALLITAIEYALNNKANIYSLPKLPVNIPDSCVMYIEAETDADVAEYIERNYRQIFTELRLAGFDFIYIPHIVAHYRESDIAMVEQIVGFVAPRLTVTGRRMSIDKLLGMDTAEFTKDILCNKLNMGVLRTAGPALLLKIGSSYVGDDVWANYLKIDIEGNDIIGVVRSLIDGFSSMISTDVVVISNDREHANQFLYSGFYKLLLDTHLLRKNVRSRIFIDPYKGEIYFPDIDVALKLHRREKALYALMLQRSASGGSVNFTPPVSAADMANYKKRMASLQRDYCSIYGLFGGDNDKAPDLSSSDLRRPMLALIKKQIMPLKDQLHNIDDYLVSKDVDGNYFVHIDPDLVYMADATSGKMLPITDF